MNSWLASIDIETASARDQQQQTLILRQVQISPGGAAGLNATVTCALGDWLVAEATSVLDSTPATQRVASCLFDNVGDMLWRQGHLREAIDLNRRALEERQDLLPPQHALTLKSMLALGSSLRSMSSGQDLEEAGRLLSEVVRVQRSVCGEQHKDTLESIGALAILRAAQSNTALREAETLHNEALAGKVSVCARVISC